MVDLLSYLLALSTFCHGQPFVSFVSSVDHLSVDEKSVDVSPVDVSPPHQYPQVKSLNPVLAGLFPACLFHCISVTEFIKCIKMS